MKQVIFTEKYFDGDYYDKYHAGILTDNGDVICLECGGLIEKDEVEIVKVFDSWVNLEEEAGGDELIELRNQAAGDKW